MALRLAMIVRLRNSKLGIIMPIKIDEEWRKDLQEEGKQATEQLIQKTGVNLAAVDIVFDLTRHNPEPLFLEINYSFGRRGLGGSENFYGLLHKAIIEWVEEKGLDPEAVRLT